MSTIRLELKDDIHIINGSVRVNYDGRFDGIQVNAYIINSNGLVEFVELNGRKISAYTRLYVAKSEMSNNELSNSEFTFKARADTKGNRIRFRAAIIQEHKEIDSITTFLEY